ncbi:MAG: prephenate dehydrogenase/arogenate dehydrogenase family protein [Gemmatimonadetes bacterium]|nr:prephenate dehydrogenase/arogenate dehydrogenase family protein [Gemmatimonadota bacterium]
MMTPDPGTAAPAVRRVAIVGLGLMGGSLARALKRLPDPPWISAAESSEHARDRALAAGVADRMCRLSSEAVRDCELAVYATAPDVTLSLLEQDREAWGPGTVVTDLASVKAPILERMHRLAETDRYVGSHPMVGDHRSGFEASRGNLYEDARVWMVQAGAVAAACERVAGFWRQLGARPAWMDADEHDELMAWVSHAPQLVANALAAALLERGIPSEQLGPGGRDATRLAASAPDLWTEILAANARRVVPVLDSVVKELAWLRDALDRGDLEGVRARMERTRAWREGV